MVSDPHLFFAEISLDLSKGEYAAGLSKLEATGGRFDNSYSFHLLFGRALKGTGRYTEAINALKRCCRIAPHNQVAWKELIETHCLSTRSACDELTSELEKISAALTGFEAPKTSETSDPTPLNEQKQPFSDEELIAVPTESLATLFTEQGAFKKAIQVYHDLMQLHPSKSDTYQKAITTLRQRL